MGSLDFAGPGMRQSYLRDLVRVTDLLGAPVLRRATGAMDGQVPPRTLTEWSYSAGGRGGTAYLTINVVDLIALFQARLSLTVAPYCSTVEGDAFGSEGV